MLETMLETLYKLFLLRRRGHGFYGGTGRIGCYNGYRFYSTLQETIDHILFAPSGPRYMTKAGGCHVTEISTWTANLRSLRHPPLVSKAKWLRAVVAKRLKHSFVHG